MTDIPRSSIARTAKLVGLPLGHAGRAALGVGPDVPVTECDARRTDSAKQVLLVLLQHLAAKARGELVTTP